MVVSPGGGTTYTGRVVGRLTFDGVEYELGPGEYLDTTTDPPTVRKTEQGGTP